MNLLKNIFWLCLVLFMFYVLITDVANGVGIFQLLYLGLFIASTLFFITNTTWGLWIANKITFDDVDVRKK